MWIKGNIELKLESQCYSIIRLFLQQEYRLKMIFIFQFWYDKKLFMQCLEPIAINSNFQMNISLRCIATILKFIYTWVSTMVLISLEHLSSLICKKVFFIKRNHHIFGRPVMFSRKHIQMLYIWNTILFYVVGYKRYILSAYIDFIS